MDFSSLSFSRSAALTGASVTLFFLLIFWLSASNQIRKAMVLLGSLLAIYCLLGSFIFLYLLMLLPLAMPAIRSRIASWIPLAIPLLGLVSYKVVEQEGAFVSSWGWNGIKLWGLSFFCFRYIHLAMDMKFGRIRNASCLDITTFMFFLPTFLSGPLVRFQSFQSQWSANNTFDVFLFRSSLLRILEGLFLKFLLANPLYGLCILILQSPEEYAKNVVAITAIFGLPIYLYFDFSSYSSIAIGAAGLIGIRLPENFQKPFLKSNPIQFWRSWHITLQTFIRDYFFLPLFGGVQTRIGLYLGTMGSLVVFCVWHRFNLGFLLLGFYYGLGVLFYHETRQIWRALDFQMGGISVRPFRFLGCIVTMAYFGAGLNLFFFDWQGTQRILTSLFG